MTYPQIEQFFFNNEEKWMREFWKSGNLTNNYAKSVNSYLVKEANMSLNKDQTNNLKNFSIGKEKDLVKKLSISKQNSNGFDEFTKLASGNFKQHTEWLKNEGLSVANGAEQIKQWDSIVRNTDRYLQWVTVGDEKVRHDHKELDGVIRKVTDPFWNNQFPGRAFNCRCTYKVLKAGSKSAIPKVESPNSYGVEVNPGMNGLFFNKNHTYLT
jgi:Phage Mu protein F like protein